MPKNKDAKINEILWDALAHFQADMIKGYLIFG